MRRAILAAMSIGMAFFAVAGLLAVDRFADPQKDVPRPTSPDKGLAVAQASRSESALKLPVARVVLFNSGVGYFQREGDIEGDAHFDLSFPVQDINDLLKSLVVQDLGGGRVSAISLDSQAPVEKTLHSFAIDLSANPSLGQILDQARGEKVEVVLQQSATSQPGSLTGALVGVEKQKQPFGKDGVVEVDQLNLWCAEGLRQVKLSDLQRIRFLNPILDSELKKALEAVTLGHDTQKKAVSFNFTGQGKRSVRVGYVVENPMWKTSYRLVLNKDSKPFLQGWAIVENTTDEDWNGVNMALVSGRPISFKMDLYQPLYVPRPIVEPELFASLRPPSYSGAMQRDPEQALNQAEANLKKLEVLRSKSQGAVSAEEYRRLKEEADQASREIQRRSGPKRKLGDALELQKGVAEAATASNLGNYFQYEIDQPISLARQKSSLLPLINKPVEGERVSIYNERVHAKFPLLGLKFKNTSDLQLPQGPVTVFDGASYAGDARLPDLQPKEERLLSYAIDLGTEVQAQPESDNGRLTALRVNKGLLITRTRQKESKTYTITNRSELDRVVLIEHPFRPDFKLTSADKPVETASDVYRFQVSVPRGKTARQTVAEQRTINETVALTNSNDEQLRFFMQSTVASPKLKEALQSALARRGLLTTTQQQIADVERELNAIKADQPRLRSNLDRIPGTDPLARRILEKLNKQETEIEQYDEQLKKLNAKADEQRRDYEGFLAKLDVE